jgi:hypothetical protein
MLILIFFFLLSINNSSNTNLVCKIETNCYGTSFCSKIKQNFIKPEHLSKTTCFNHYLTFIMGTDKPVFKSDGSNFILINKYFT